MKAQARVGALAYNESSPRRATNATEGLIANKERPAMNLTARPSLTPSPTTGGV